MVPLDQDRRNKIAQNDEKKELVDNDDAREIADAELEQIAGGEDEVNEDDLLEGLDPHRKLRITSKMG